MKYRLNIVLECYSINLILESTRQFKWLGGGRSERGEIEKMHQPPITPPIALSITPSIAPILNVGNSIEFILINIQKLKVALEDHILKEYELQFPFTYNDFNIFARKLASSLTNSSSLIKNLEYMKDYILAPLMVSSHEVIIGIILDELISKPLFKSTDILESNNYLSQINSINPKDSKDILNNMEYLCDILNGILTMDKNNLPTKMKLYIMNCRGYIPRVLIRRMPKKMTSINFFQNRLNP